MATWLLLMRHTVTETEAPHARLTGADMIDWVLLHRYLVVLTLPAHLRE
jgi:hypothetical protein